MLNMNSLKRLSPRQCVIRTSGPNRPLLTAKLKCASTHWSSYSSIYALISFLLGHQGLERNLYNLQGYRQGDVEFRKGVTELFAEADSS